MRQEHKALTHRTSPGIGVALTLATSILYIGSPVFAGVDAAAQPSSFQQGNELRRTSHDIDRLFGEEMKMAGVKLKWHGERLTEDTIYALALTGASWEPAWGKETLFSLAWGDAHKVPTLNKHNVRGHDALIAEIAGLYQARQYRRVVDTASASFSLDEIGVDVNLKQYVGDSLLQLGQPEQAFPIFAAAFEPSANEPKSSEHNRRFREEALEAARRAGLRKEVVAFTLSLLLDPDVDDPRPDTTLISFLEGEGVDVDRVLLGILQAPEKLRGLPAYFYAASDLMAFRASPRLFPFLLQLADSNDVYLRSRALLGLGMVAYRGRPGDPPGWSVRIISAQPREFGISSGERKFVDKELKDGANSDKYRVRAAAALALGLIGDPDSVAVLQKLSKDRAYILIADNGERSKSRRILFPVRMAAAAALSRYGVDMGASGGELSGKELEKAKRGGSDETNDHRNLRKDVASILTISPVDLATGVPFR